jgi:hypothetical protein
MEPQTKGIGFRNFVTCLGRLKGPGAVAAMLAALPADLAGQLRDELLFSGNWYPLAWYRELHRAAQQATGAGPELARAIGYESVKADLSGIYKIFILVVSPQFLLARAPRLFGNYYDTGTMTVLEAERGRARARWSGCAGFDANVWQDILGGCEAALHAAGAKELVFDTITGGGDADQTLEVTARWQ